MEKYDALAMLNKLMRMETFSFVDDESQCYKRSDLHLYEMYQTRLLRVDVGLSSGGDPLQLMIHKWLLMLHEYIQCDFTRGDHTHSIGIHHVNRPIDCTAD